MRSHTHTYTRTHKHTHTLTHTHTHTPSHTRIHTYAHTHSHTHTHTHTYTHLHTHTLTQTQTHTHIHTHTLHTHIFHTPFEALTTILLINTQTCAYAHTYKHTYTHIAADTPFNHFEPWALLSAAQRGQRHRAGGMGGSTTWIIRICDMTHSLFRTCHTGTHTHMDVWLVSKYTRHLYQNIHVIWCRSCITFVTWNRKTQIFGFGACQDIHVIWCTAYCIWSVISSISNLNR